VGGVYSSIEQTDPYVYEDGQQYPSAVAYVMLARDPTSYMTGPYAQAGWGKIDWPGIAPIRRSFAQWLQTDNDGASYYAVTRFEAGFPPGYFRVYTVLYDDASHRFTFQVEGWTFATGRADFRPLQGKVSLEIVNKASQMPGGTSAPTKFWDNSLYYSGGWHDLVPDLKQVTDTSIHDAVVPVPWYMETWDKACIS
jgi:hypothetical protein